MRLQGKIVVVAGGSGAVGEGIVQVLLRAGAKVVVPLRDRTKEESLRAFLSDHPNLVLRVSDPSNYSSNVDLINQITLEYGKIDLGIASLGGWYQGGRMDQVPVADWLSVVENNLNSHFVFAKAMLGYFHQRKSGIYVMINGGAAEMVVPHAGPMSIAAAAQRMMAEVLHSETRGTRIKVYAVAAFTPVITRSRPVGQPGWLTTEDIGNYLVDLFDGDRQDKVIHRLSKNQQ